MSLQPQAELFEVEVLPGVSFTVKPLSTLDKAVCEAAARRRVDEMENSLDDCFAAGLCPLEIDLSNPDQRSGLYQDLLIKEIAVRHIQSWTGVVPGDADEPADLSPENIRTVMDDPVISDAFYREVMKYHWEISAAKKGLGVAAHGISSAEEAPDIAEAAQQTACPAPAEKKG